MYIVAIAVGFLAFARDSIEPSIYLYRESNGSLGELAVVGWLISTAAPVSVSLLLFVYISRFKTRWLVHLVFIGLATMLFRLGGDVFIYGSGVSGNNSPEGHSLLLGSVLLLLTLVVHVISLLVEVYRKMVRPANGN
jgi:hypothetical protein